jgi:hypothetical protein
MFGIFKPKASKIIDTFQAQAFSAWGVQKSDVATILRFRAGLGIYTSILLSSFGSNREQINQVSNEIFSKIIASVADEKCRVSDIFSITNNVKCIDFSQEKFLSVANLPSANVVMNGRGVLDCLAQAYGADCAKFLQGRDGANMQNAGMLLLTDFAVGNAEGKAIAALSVSQCYMKFFDKIMKPNR